MARLNLERVRKVHQVLVLALLVCGNTVINAQRSMRMAETQQELVGDTSHFDMLPPLLSLTGTQVDTNTIGAETTTVSQLIAATNSDAVVVPPETLMGITSLATTSTTTTDVSTETEEAPEVVENLVETTTGTSSASSSSASTEFAQVNSLKTGAAATESTEATTTSKDSSGSSSSSGSGKHDYEFGAGDHKTYKCACDGLQRVSLMGRSNYCLPQHANVNDKCGNVNLGAKGECPRRGAEPCSPELGYNLTQDSVCLLDDRDNVYKCVASAEDLERLRTYGKKKLKSAQSNTTAAVGSVPPSSAAPQRRPTLALHAVTLVATLALGVATLL